MKRIVICADDFGYNREVSLGIIKLLEYGTINATSCMVNMPISRDQIERLINVNSDNIDIGLHLNFTEGLSLRDGKPLLSLKEILIKSHLHRLNYHKIYEEVRQQVIKFINLFNKNPDFIDGHQHVHHLPIIRKALIKIYSEFELNKSSTYIRSVSNIKGGNSIKTQIIKSTGARRLTRFVNMLNIPTNDNFSGVYNFSKYNTFRNTMNNAYSKILDKGIIMCHPGLKSNTIDILKDSRPIEFKYFLSEQCRDDQRSNNIILKSGKDIFL